MNLHLIVMIFWLEMRKQMILFVFASSYPFDAAVEQTFLGVEIKHLCDQFDRVILVPKSCKGNRLSVPAGVEVDESFAKSFTWINRVIYAARSVFSPYFYQDIKRKWPASFHWYYLLKLAAFLAGTRITRKWLKHRFETEKISPRECIFYSFWFDEVITGIGMSKEDYPDIRLVSRTHGYDLYEDIYGVWPCRYEAISLLDNLFPDSDAGEVYLKKKYPEFAGVYQTALLGVPDFGGISRVSDDKVFRIVSCALIHPVKRLDLLMEGISVAARMRPEQRFEWRHFGNGEARDEYQKNVRAILPSNAVGIFPGYTTQDDLIHEYLSTPVDVFMNVSKTEGTPVSVMEAISCGIPVIATAVGGNVEIVSEKNGHLLRDNPSPEEIAEAILWALDHEEAMAEKRRGSRDVWYDRYNASRNYQRFAERISEIRRK